MTADLAVVLSDLLRASLDGERVRLPPRAERRVIALMVELAELMGVETVIADATTHDQTRHMDDTTPASVEIVWESDPTRTIEM